jgi:hypothetical protein
MIYQMWGIMRKTNKRSGVSGMEKNTVYSMIAWDNASLFELMEWFEDVRLDREFDDDRYHSYLEVKICEDYSIVNIYFGNNTAREVEFKLKYGDELG